MSPGYIFLRNILKYIIFPFRNILWIMDIYLWIRFSTIQILFCTMQISFCCTIQILFCTMEILFFAMQILSCHLDDISHSWRLGTLHVISPFSKNLLQMKIRNFVRSNPKMIRSTYYTPQTNKLNVRSQINLLCSNSVTSLQLEKENTHHCLSEE